MPLKTVPKVSTEAPFDESWVENEKVFEHWKQKAVDACTNAGGGDVVFSANHTFLSGPVQLKSNVNIVLETNSVWKANPDESIYHLSAFGKNEGEGMMWIWAKDVENLSFSGHGWA